MAAKQVANLTIQFTDGTEERYAFLREDALRGSLARVEEALKANVVVLELDDRVRILPVSNIKSIEVVPPPRMLPEYAVENVRLMP